MDSISVILIIDPKEEFHYIFASMFVSMVWGNLEGLSNIYVLFDLLNDGLKKTFL